MWNTFNSLAERAKAVAADLEGHIDKSVGIDTPHNATLETTAETAKTAEINDDDFGDNDGWNDDFPMDDDLELSGRSNKAADVPPPESEKISDDPAPPSSESSPPDEQTIPNGGDASVDVPLKDDLTGQMPKTHSGSLDDVITAENQCAENPMPSPTENPSEKIEEEFPVEAEAPDGVNDEQIPLVSESTSMPSQMQQVENSTTVVEEPPQAPELIQTEENASKKTFTSSDDAFFADPHVDEIDQEGSQLSPPDVNDDSTRPQPETQQLPEINSGESVQQIPDKPIEVFDDIPQTSVSDPETRTEEPRESTKDSSAIENEKYDSEANAALREQVAFLQDQLRQRENQLVNKTEQLTSLQSMFESEKADFQQRLENMKEEAKRRIAKAKERVDAAEKRVAALSSSTSESSAQNEEIIAALRAEGEKLAHKQLEMEKAVRTAKGEARELRESLEAEEQAKINALEKIAKLEADLKNTKSDLASARRGESQASKLEMELQSAREESERKATTILSLEQHVKELKASSKDLQTQLEEARKGAVLDSEREQKKLKKEHISMLEDLETKLRTTEKEAAVREDALRHEVAELRKRWQDAVRRADSLSMDVQSSTAPLLRQLESMERQNRTRAAGWATLETKLRQDLEDSVVESEKLQKERNDLKSKTQLLERKFKDTEAELQQLQAAHEEKTKEWQLLQTKLSQMESVHAAKMKELDEAQRLANDAAARVRSEMTQTVVEAEERHVSQLDSIKRELGQEREKRKQLEEQVQGFLDKATAMVLPVDNNRDLDEQMKLRKAPPKKLGSGQGQAEILAGALNGLGDDEDDEDKEEGINDGEDSLMKPMNGSISSSFAALEELQSRLRVTQGELKTLRKSLEDSEKSREKLLAELAQSRHAKERLPVVESMLEKLTAENNEKTLEIQGLQDDIREVRELYRSQLNILIEEKATVQPDEENENTSGDNGDSSD